MKPNLIRRLIESMDRYPIWKGRWKKQKCLIEPAAVRIVQRADASEHCFDVGLSKT
jgi:hypothetical protein